MPVGLDGVGLNLVLPTDEAREIAKTILRIADAFEEAATTEARAALAKGRGR